MIPPTSHPRQTPIEIIRRRVRLTYDSARARGWTKLPRVNETGLNAISFLFPVGEAFFCRSVAHYRDRITDPVLRDAADRFIHQEAMHSREHARSNRALQEAKVPGAELESLARFLLGLSKAVLPRSTQLAMTCAMEHFTAMLAERLLAKRTLYREGVDPDFANLWLWHAAEEIEHKAVCFDVYDHIFGSGFWAWLHRCAAMGMVTFFGGGGLLAGLMVMRIKAMRRRGAGPAGPGGGGGGGGGTSLRVIFGGVAARAYYDYFRRDFHPWDQDDRPLLEAWKMEHPGFGLGGDHHAHAHG
ncbi:metal-dependent hydrolase [Falsiroseomonas tokyonensis]|uniref:Metal-dependent hydrolase n=1 Tax=Falsiroseomonas tokyonensis TaxID=430521 RepID=A0ABV7BZI0_9PROT|nr:metal-dependent hydrolase [Falsiroseomonas tokyonensis]